MRILVVDDNPDILESLALVLQSAGHDARTAVDSRLALRLHLERPADLLITDIFMPGADGFETIAAFRERSPDLKIIAMSGGGQLARRDYLGVAMEVGADVMMRKPFDPADLLRTLDEMSADAA